MHKIAIIADDLTGALDAAAPLRRQGFRATVALAPAHTPASVDADIVAVTTESRYLSDPGPALAAAVGTLPGESLLYKKIDSTLRGPIAAELRLFLEITGRKTALITPTLPQQGRALVHGRLLLDGQATDLLLPAMLVSSGLQIRSIPLEVVREPEGLQRALMLATEQASLIAVDAVTDDDLRAIAQVVMTLATMPLLAGSAGLAAWLPLIGGLAPSVQGNPGNAQIDGPVLFAFGSAHARTHAQLAELRLEPVQSVVVAASGDLVSSGVETAVHALSDGDDVVLSVLPPSAPIDQVPYDEQHALAQTVARTVASIVERAPVASLVLGGGDTAYAVCRHLGIHYLVLDDEVLPGLPLSHGITSAGKTIRCVTKAGGFGMPDALRRVRAALHGASLR